MIVDCEPSIVRPGLDVCAIAVSSLVDCREQDLQYTL